MKAYLIHGFNVRDNGAGSVLKLRPYLKAKGFEVVALGYEWTGRLGVRLCNPKLASFLASLVDEESVAVGHSNGCAIIDEACRRGALFSQVAYINPALDPDLAPVGWVKRADVFYSTGDWATTLARFIPFSTWGAMGAKGYTGKDSRVVNHEMGSFGHSDVFNDKHLKTWGPRIASALSTTP